MMKYYETQFLHTRRIYTVKMSTHTQCCENQFGHGYKTPLLCLHYMELINFLSSDPSDHFSFKKGLVAEYFVCVRLMAHLRLCTSCMPTTSSLKITSSFYGGGRWKKKKLLIEIAAAADCFASFLLIYLTRKILCFIN